MVQELGADEVVDYRTEEFAERYKDKPFDLVIDSVGGALSCHADKAVTSSYLFYVWTCCICMGKVCSCVGAKWFRSS